MSSLFSRVWGSKPETKEVKNEEGLAIKEHISEKDSNLNIDDLRQHDQVQNMQIRHVDNMNFFAGKLK